MTLQAVLPAEALVRWRALERGRSGLTDPLPRLRHWLARLAARMICSGGRLAARLVGVGLTDVETLAECVRDQLKAGSLGQGQLRHDVDSDVDFLFDRGPLALLEEISATMAALDWDLPETLFRHGDLATLLLAAGRLDDAEAALERITWNGALVDWLKVHGAALPPEARDRWLSRAANGLREAALIPSHQVHAFIEFAIVSGDRRWVERGEAVLSTLTARDIEMSGHTEHHATELAWGFAKLGDAARALSILSAVDPVVRWSGLLRVVPLLGEGVQRAALRDEILAGVKELDRGWWEVVEALPETLDRALSTIAGMEDDEARLDALASLLPSMDPDRARQTCAALVAESLSLEPDDPRWVDSWGQTLAALGRVRCQSLLDDDGRCRLIDALLANPATDVWPEAADFVPDDRASAVLALSYERLAAAAHYTERERWIDVGVPLLGRVPRHDAARWREVAARQIAGTGIEGEDNLRMAIFEEAEQRGIVLARLGRHQREFLPEWQLEAMFRILTLSIPSHLWPAWDHYVSADTLARHRELSPPTPVLAAAEAGERAIARETFERLTATTAWPTHDEIEELFAAIGRFGGEALLRAALQALLDLRVSFEGGERPGRAPGALPE